MSGNSKTTGGAVWAERRRKVARVSKAWMALFGEGILMPLRPSAPRLRRALVAGELLSSHLPLVRVESLLNGCLDDADVLTLQALPALEHNCTLFELLVLALAVKAVRAHRVLEIGTFDGRSALAMAQNVGDGDEVYTLNLPPEHVEGSITQPLRYDERLAGKVSSGYRWRGRPQANRIHQLFGNSLDFDFSPYAPSQVVFIDGGHGEAIVRSDTENCLKIVDRQNGIILWHDATRYGVRPALAQLATGGHKIHLIEGTSLAVLRFKEGREVPLMY